MRAGPMTVLRWKSYNSVGFVPPGIPPPSIPIFFDETKTPLSCHSLAHAYNVRRKHKYDDYAYALHMLTCYMHTKTLARLYYLRTAYHPKATLRY